MAVAASNGLIIKVGSDADMEQYMTSRAIDCVGNTIMPGMCDAHCHPSIASSLYVGCNLFGIYIQEGQAPQEITGSVYGKAFRLRGCTPRGRDHQRNWLGVKIELYRCNNAGPDMISTKYAVTGLLFSNHSASIIFATPRRWN